MRQVPSFTAVVMGAALAFASCKSNDITATTNTISIGQQCIASGSDSGTSGGCAGSAVCSVNYCRTACTSDDNCGTGGVCLSGSGGNGCRVEMKEGHCATTNDCTAGLVCAADKSCRNVCVAGTPCSIAGDVCTDGACYGPSSSGMDGGGVQDATGIDATALDATVPDGAAAQEGGSLDSGITLNPCPAAQEQFGFTAQGDSNSNFTSGVGVRTADQLLIFSGYSGPPVSGFDSGGASTVNLVFMQAFDPVTGKKLGPAVPLFRGPDSGPLYVLDVSISPLGQIALAFAGSASNYFAGTYVTLISPASGGDAAALPQVGQTVSLAPANEGNLRPQIIWSAASQTFAVSWVDLSAGNVKVAELLSDGRPGGGPGGVVPTPGLYGNVNGSVGTAGSFSGIGYIAVGLSLPYLTILDSAGSQVGSSIQLEASSQSAWTAVAGSTQGFVALYDNGSAGAVAFVSTSADGGAAGGSGDGGDAGPLPGFVLPGALRPVDARAISDETGGAGGVGAVVATTDTVTFFYVNPDGLSLAHSNSLFGQGVGYQASRTVGSGFVTLSNFRGLFAASLYDATKHATMAVASGCK
ncbi:MAG: hypothetical protein M3O46_14620 [Myxococcota bacterium]|nr:hypothetical protein [Myxococcota bacterium]